MSDVIVVIGSGAIGQAIARRVATGKTVLLADLQGANAEAVAGALGDAGFKAHAKTVDVTSRTSVEEKWLPRPQDWAGPPASFTLPASPSPALHQP